MQAAKVESQVHKYEPRFKTNNYWKHGAKAIRYTGDISNFAKEITNAYIPGVSIASEEDQVGLRVCFKIRRYATSHCYLYKGSWLVISNLNGHCQEWNNEKFQEFWRKVE